MRRIYSYRTGICREMDQLYARRAVNVFGKYATRWSRLPGLLRHERHLIELRKAGDTQLSWPTTHDSTSLSELTIRLSELRA